MNVQVGTLTVRATRRGAGRDAGFRVRTESRLRSLDLHPRGLPGHAILIVGRLELPAADRATAQQARTALDRLRQAAARPAAGPVAADTQAVLFNDEVELLACLTADLVRGAASHRWYWRHVRPAMAAEPGTELAAAWTRDVRWLPGSLARLPVPEARQAVSLLSPSVAARVLRALLGAFGVADQPAQPSPELTRPPPGPPPWRPWLPSTSLPPEAEALWGVALSLHHAPAVVRSPGYARELAAWQAAAGQATGFRSPARERPDASRPGAGRSGARKPCGGIARSTGPERRRTGKAGSLARAGESGSRARGGPGPSGADRPGRSVSWFC